MTLNEYATLTSVPGLQPHGSPGVADTLPPTLTCTKPSLWFLTSFSSPSALFQVLSLPLFLAQLGSPASHSWEEDCSGPLIRILRWHLFPSTVVQPC